MALTIISMFTSVRSNLLLGQKETRQYWYLKITELHFGIIGLGSRGGHPFTRAQINEQSISPFSNICCKKSAFSTFTSLEAIKFVLFVLYQEFENHHRAEVSQITLSSLGRSMEINPCGN